MDSDVNVALLHLQQRRNRRSVSASARVWRMCARRYREEPERQGKSHKQHTSFWMCVSDCASTSPRSPNTANLRTKATQLSAAVAQQRFGKNRSADARSAASWHRRRNPQTHRSGYCVCLPEPMVVVQNTSDLRQTEIAKPRNERRSNCGTDRGARQPV